MNNDLSIEIASNGHPMSKRPVNTEYDADGFRKRLQWIISTKFENNVRRFAVKCKCPTHNAIRAYLKAGSIPRSDYLLNMAVAGGVMVQWLLTGEGARGLGDSWEYSKKQYWQDDYIAELERELGRAMIKLNKL